MRFTPAAIALSVALAITSSASFSQQPERSINPQSVVLVNAANSAQRTGELDEAANLYEAALAVDPANLSAFIGLAEVARAQDLPGKAIRLYREALELNPNDKIALAGQGEALVQRGAVEKARINLARLENICGNCAEITQLNAALEKGPPARVVSAEAITPEPIVGESTEQP